MKKIAINLKFSGHSNHLGCVETALVKAFKRQKITLSKVRFTYVECEHGSAEMPQLLFLVSLIGDTDVGTGFNWYLDKLSGSYTFEFKK